MAIFFRNDFLKQIEANDTNVDEDVEHTQAEVEPADGYNLIHSVSYPFYRDTRSLRQKILEECQYHINRYRWMDEYYNYDNQRIEIPIDRVANACWEITDSVEEILPIIESSFETEGDLIILPENEDLRDY